MTKEEEEEMTTNPRTSIVKEENRQKNQERSVDAAADVADVQAVVAAVEAEAEVEAVVDVSAVVVADVTAEAVIDVFSAAVDTPVFSRNLPRSSLSQRWDQLSFKETLFHQEAK